MCNLVSYLDNTEPYFLDRDLSAGIDLFQTTINDKLKNYDIHLGDQEFFKKFYYPPIFVQGSHVSDIEGVVREAAILALRKNSKAKEVTMKHFEEALEQVSPSVTEDTVKYYAELGKKLRTRARRGERRSESDLYM